MSKMSNVVKTVAVIAIATVIGRSVGYFTGTRMAASSQTASSTSSKQILQQILTSLLTAAHQKLPLQHRLRILC